MVESLFIIIAVYITYKIWKWIFWIIDSKVAQITASFSSKIASWFFNSVTSTSSSVLKTIKNKSLNWLSKWGKNLSSQIWDLKNDINWKDWNSYLNKKENEKEEVNKLKEQEGENSIIDSIKNADENEHVRDYIWSKIDEKGEREQNKLSLEEDKKERKILHEMMNQLLNIWEIMKWNNKLLQSDTWKELLDNLEKAKNWKIDELKKVELSENDKENEELVKLVTLFNAKIEENRKNKEEKVWNETMDKLLNIWKIIKGDKQLLKSESWQELMNNLEKAKNWKLHELSKIELNKKEKDNETLLKLVNSFNSKINENKKFKAPEEKVKTPEVKQINNKETIIKEVLNKDIQKNNKWEKEENKIIKEKTIIEKTNSIDKEKEIKSEAKIKSNKLPIWFNSNNVWIEQKTLKEDFKDKIKNVENKIIVEKEIIKEAPEKPKVPNIENSQNSVNSEIISFQQKTFDTMMKNVNLLVNQKDKNLNEKIIWKSFAKDDIKMNVTVINNLRKQYSKVSDGFQNKPEFFNQTKNILNRLDFLHKNIKGDINLNKKQLTNLLSVSNNNLSNILKSKK